MNEGIEASAKAIQEVSKVSGKGIDSIRDLCSFIAKFTGGSLQEAIGIFEDKLRYARWENQNRLIERANKFLEERGVNRPNQFVPFNVSIPLLQAASLEEDPTLQDLWANLLVNYSLKESGVPPRRLYVDILEQLFPLDAHILSKVYSIPFDLSDHKSVITSNLPLNAVLAKDDSPTPLNPPEEVMISLSNLERLNCLYIVRSIDGIQIFGLVNHSFLGKDFIKACML